MGNARSLGWVLAAVCLTGCATGTEDPADTADLGDVSRDDAAEAADVPEEQPGEVLEADGEGGCPEPRLLCGERCVDPAADPFHCGGCDLPCRPLNATGSCVDGVCTADCDEGWVDANRSTVDGCEYECRPQAPAEVPELTCEDLRDNDCDLRTDATDPDCAACVPEFCNAADDDCDGLTDEDFDPDFDALNCGRCGAACPSRTRATPACVLGVCTVRCYPGWADADGLVENGCESGCTPATAPDETGCDGTDDDCDGLTDEDWVAVGGCGEGPCRRPAVCHHGETVCRPRAPLSAGDATCDGVDDDCDGTTDDEAACGCATGAECDDGNPCTDETCGADHLCHVVARPDGASCSGGVCCGRACVDAAAEACNGRDDNCNGVTDEGHACSAGSVVACTTACGAAGTGLCSALCTPPAGAACAGPAETCNGADDDCDTAPDDGFACARGALEPCTTGGGAPGSRTCGSDCTWGACAATGEACNGTDDDGDGLCDEGFACCRGGSESRACACGGGRETRACSGSCTWSGWSGCPAGDCLPGGAEACWTSCSTLGVRRCADDCTWGGCAPPAEACNGMDDDCDTLPDDGFGCVAGAWETCTSGCGSTGSRTCSGACSWNACTPPAEVCNGADDDCDTVRDDGYACVPGTPESCTTGCGTAGSRVCSPLCAWGACAPPGETCNGVDDDCDGATDEGFECPLGSGGACTTGCGTAGSRSCSGACTWGGCVPPGETCNGADDDCDGGCDEGCRQPIHRSVHPSLNDHLYTPDAGEAACCGYTVESYNYFYLYLDGAAVTGTTPFYRCYFDGDGHSFYTADPGCEGSGATNLGSIGRLGGSALCGGTPLFRLYHSGTGRHFYCWDPAERDAAVASGWTYESIVGYVWLAP